MAKEHLKLSGDGTFIQSVVIKSTGSVNAAKGTWSYDPKTGYIKFSGSFMLVLDGFRKFNPNFSEATTGDVINEVHKTFGRLRIGVDEAGIMYVKQ